MGACFLYGNGGGSDLNFTVRAYATKAELLASAPKENTLGVVTNVPPIAWSFYNEAPGWAEDDGSIYFVVPTFSSLEATSFNTTKKYNLWLAPTGCYQRISGAWKKMAAYVYKGGTWVQFSSEFAATINVTYPAGSTCTATDGKTTLTAPDTSGAWACVVPNTGTWVVTCTNGSSAKTASVSITEDGESKSITLSYALPYFYNAGDFTVKWLGSGSNSGGVLTVSGGSASAGTFEGYFVIPDIHNYKTISCYISSYTNVKPTVSIRNISTGTNVASAKPSSGGSTVSLDVSSLSGNGYYFVLSTNSTWEDEWVISNVKTTKIWGDAR